MSDSVQPHRWKPTRLPHSWDSPGKNTGVGCHFLLQCMKVKSEREVAQSCLTHSNPMDCSLPGSAVHGIFQARVLEWGAIALGREQSPTLTPGHWSSIIFASSAFQPLLSATAYVCTCQVTSLCPTLCDFMDCNLSWDSILQTRILEWVAMHSSKGSSQPRDQTHISYVSCIDRQVLYH